jgi:hypothetical protein
MRVDLSLKGRGEARTESASIHHDLGRVALSGLRRYILLMHSRLAADQANHAR